MSEAAEPLWTLRKADGEIRATLVNRGLLGWEVVVLVDGERWYGQHDYATRDEAIRESTTYRLRFELQGWTALV